MNQTSLGLVLAMLIAGAVPAFAANRLLILQNLPPIRPGEAAFPLIADPVDAAERTINKILQKSNRTVRDAGRPDCSEDQAGKGQARRSVEIIQQGPRFLTFVVRDCDTEVEAIGYDLSNGAQVDWRVLLPPSLRGEAGVVFGYRDGTELQDNDSKELYALYRGAYRPKPSRQTGNLDDADCRQVIAHGGDAPGILAWPDAKRRGLVLKYSMWGHPEFEVCADEVVIPAAVIRARDASPSLLEAMGVDRARSD